MYVDSLIRKNMDTHMNKLVKEKHIIRPWGALPFRMELSFQDIFKYWEEQANSDSNGAAMHAKEVLRELEDYPELRAPILDVKTIYNNAEPLKKLLSVLFPEPLQDNEIKTGAIPFTDIYFNPTRRFQNIVTDAGDDFELKIRNVEEDLFYTYACMFLLQFQYGVNLKTSRSYYLDVPNLKTNRTHHYRVMFNGDFSQIEPVDPDFSISKEDIELLRNNAHNIEVWKEIFPPNSFVFRGFGILTLFDVTIEEIISELKTELLHPDVFQSETHLKSIRDKVVRILEMSSLEMGMFILDEHTESVECFRDVQFKSLVLQVERNVPVTECFCGYGQEELLRMEPVFFSDLTKLTPEDHPQVHRLAKTGIRSYVAIPVRLDNDLIGVIEFGSPHVREINRVSMNRIFDVIPIFAVTMQRWMVGHETLMESIIQKNFTVIHPTVSWKFFEVAEDLWISRQTNPDASIKDIVFEDVTPLFGQSDIKGSTDERNLAVQTDLIHQLKLAGKILKEALEVEPLILYRQLLHRLEEASLHLKSGMDAGDEVTMGEFLVDEIYPAFKHIRTLSPAMNKKVNEYNEKLDETLGFVYAKRKDFEDSVAMINDQMANYLDRQQEEAQKIYPHYFEKYKTDGVEYNMYVGQSLVKKQNYSPIYLQNLQLWQLQTMVGTERLVHSLQPKLPLKLQIASLIMVHGSPITVKFKMSSKSFDVDGAYNIRYEILKKRIDKAYVKGASERLTLPGKIAIVYSQERDAETYRRYLNFLADAGMIHPEIEELELEDLQGVTGLKALRVAVNYE